MLKKENTLDTVLQTLEHVILGKPLALRNALCCLLARGHLLIEDQPGVGKTTLAHALAKVLGLSYQRIQFTSDLLPADILGVSVYDKGAGRFEFHPGPIFSEVVVADEINRATPKAQSALLEGMEERQVTIDTKTHRLPEPFYVIATQNPQTQIGTYPLPESQLDRFLMRIHLGYPDKTAERALLKGTERRELLADLPALTNADSLNQWQQAVEQVHCSDVLLDYIQALLDFSRESGLWQHGLSPRAGLGLLRAARAWALIEGRQHVLPDDIQAVLPAVADHRLLPFDHSVQHSAGQLLLENVPVS